MNYIKMHITNGEVTKEYQVLIIPRIGEKVRFGFDNLNGTVIGVEWVRTNEVKIYLG